MFLPLNSSFFKQPFEHYGQIGLVAIRYIILVLGSVNYLNGKKFFYHENYYWLYTQVF
jgi:hypothetical protein